MYSPLPAALSQAATSQVKKPIRSTLVSRNVTIAGHRTSVRLEPDMWSGLEEICRRERGTLHQICTRVANDKSADTSLTAAIRVHVMNYYRASSTEDGHCKAGHGPIMRMSAMHSVPPAAPMAAAAKPVSAQPQSAVPAPRQVMPAKPFMIGMSHMNDRSTMR